MHQAGPPKNPLIGRMTMAYRQADSLPTRPARTPVKDEFSLVYDRYFSAVYRFIYYKTFHRERAEDLTGQAFLMAYEKYHTFDPAKGSVIAWLYRIAGNSVTDYYRRSRKTVSIHDVWDIAGEDDVALDHENREKLLALRKAMAELSAPERDVLILRIWEDVPYRTIASLLNRTEAACKMLFSRTLVRLRTTLGAAALLALLLAPAVYR
jgi:RNA polymerase sigma-70 factor (ECF subfamily)